ncbi:uncharacterized protein LOC110876004 [Helianthus annuus]|uniref:uncharacterized protein LOC110876004 n=1 Tax=Helianthus annuus TaxID=4232 RepID=UPI000B8FA1EC|nr:uncharacterized protein LOC110876004 [Helianthus annuus]
MFLAPKKVIKALEAIRRDFIWGRKAGKHKIRWIAWSQMTRDRALGGMGLGNLRNTNLAFMTKWWWKYKAKPKELWTRVIKAIHDNNRSYKLIPSNKKVAGVWKDITKAGKELESMGVSITDELTVEVGNGKAIKFWLDRWSGDRSLKDAYPGIFKIAENKHAMVADYVTVLQNENQWFITCTRPPNTDEEWSQWANLLQQINGTRVSGKEDRWGWKSDSKGIFSVAAVRNQLNKAEVNQEVEEWKLWNKWVPPKANYFSWRAALEKISVKRELVRRGMNISNVLCPRCGVSEETVDHLICECRVSQRIWVEVSKWLKVPSISGRRNCKELMEHCYTLKGSGDWRKIINVVIQAALWNIWKSRNDKEFEGHLRNEKEILDNIMEDSFIWVKTRSKIQGIVWERWLDFNIRDVVS